MATGHLKLFARLNLRDVRLIRGLVTLRDKPQDQFPFRKVAHGVNLKFCSCANANAWARILVNMLTSFRIDIVRLFSVPSSI